MQNILQILQLMTAVAATAAPVATALIQKDEDRRKAEQAAAVFIGAMTGLQKTIVPVLEGLRDPSTITLSELFTRDADAVLEQIKREREQ